MSVKGGDDLQGYRTVRSAAGVVSRDDRAQIRMWGKDPVRMLNGLITNDLGSVDIDRMIYGAMLTPKGRMITDLRAWLKSGPPQSELVIDIPSLAIETVAAHLRKYVPPLFARWELASSRMIGVYGPLAADVVATVVVGEPPAGDGGVVWARVGDSVVSVVTTRIAGGEMGFDLVVEVEEYDRLWQALEAGAHRLGGGRVELTTLETLRIEGGIPRFGLDMNEQSMPAEVFATTGLMGSAVSFTKGCYTGQEVVVRIAHRGHVNRLLRGLLVEGDGIPEAGTSLFDSSAKQVGWTTSSTYSPLLGRPVALGMLRREMEPGSRVRLASMEGPAAEVTFLPFRPEAIS